MSSTPKSNNLRSTRSSDLCFRRTKPAWCYVAQAPKCIKRFYATLFAHLTNFFRTSFIRDWLLSSRVLEPLWRGGVRRCPRKDCQISTYSPVEGGANTLPRGLSALPTNRKGSPPLRSREKNEKTLRYSAILQNKWGAMTHGGAHSLKDTRLKTHDGTPSSSCMRYLYRFVW